MKQTSKYKMHLEHQIDLIREEMLNTVRDYIRLIAYSLSLYFKYKLR